MRDIPSYSVVIPLFDDCFEVSRAVTSAFAQSVQPAEILVIDDGSTDGGGQVIEELGLPLVRVVRQPHGGVSAARNRGIAEAAGDYVCFLDSDDWWDEDYLHHITNMVNKRPGCGIYCTGFWKHHADGKMYLNEHKVKTVGVVKNYFRQALRLELCHTSAVTVPRSVFARVGDFPVGMLQGEDTYMWIKIAREYDVCYLPARMSNINLITPHERVYRPETETHSFLELRAYGNAELDEYLALCQINLGILQSESGFTELAAQSARDCAYTKSCRGRLRKLKMLNRMPLKWRRRAVDFYKKTRWILLHK